MNVHTSQQDQRVYRIALQGQIDDEFVAAYCPPGTVLAREGNATALSNIHADQSAIVGLVRHLHNLGCSLLALETDQNQERTQIHAHDTASNKPLSPGHS